jgi:hypothetical protein
MNRFSALTVALAMVPLWTTAQQNPYREFEVPTANEGVVLDGILTPGEYENALYFELFNEMDPDPNGTPPVLSKAYVYRSENALIIGFDCPLVSMDHLRANVQPRDEAWGDDIIGVTMDLYGDMRNTIFIASNALGVQIDVRNNNPTVESEESYDVGYNITFENKAHIDEHGWTAEIRVPFSSLQFENKEVQKWRVGFFREYFVGAQVHRAVTMLRDFNNPCFDCQFNDFLILRNIQSSARRDILPYVFSGVPVGTDGVGEPSLKMGLSGFYGINSQNSIEVALNPDFSTVESDATQLSVNSATSLYYPERRPFFNEGADLLVTTLNLFYSRTISNPVGMAKYLGQGKNLRSYALAGYDMSSPYLVPGENRDIVGTAGQSFASVVRLSKPRNNGENLGFLSTNRLYLDGGSGHLNALTVRENITESIRFYGEYAWSHTVEPDANWVNDTQTFGNHTAATDGETYDGFAFSQGLNRTTTHWVTDAYWNLVDQNFRADMGFVPLNNRTEFGAMQKYVGRPNTDLLKSYQLSGGVNGTVTPQGLWKNQIIQGVYNVQLAGNLMLGGNIEHRLMEEFEGNVLNGLTSVVSWVNWSPVQTFRMNMYLNPGEFVAYNTGVPRIGNGLNYGANVNVLLAQKLQINLNGNYGSLWERDGSGMIYEGWIWRSVVRFNPNRYVQARLIAQWNQFSGDYSLQPLVQYQPSPFTIFYLGSSTYFSGTQRTSNVFAKAQITLGRK